MSQYLATLQTRAEPMIALLDELGALPERTPDQQAEYDRTMAGLTDLKGHIDAEAERETKAREIRSSFLQIRDTPRPRASAFSPRPDDRPASPEFKSWWSTVKDSQQYADFLRTGKLDAVEVPGVRQVLEHFKAIYAPGATNAGQVQVFSSVGNPPVRFPLLDLMPMIPFNGASVPYLPMTTSGTIAQTNWGVTKPVIDNAGDVQYAPMETIAGTKTVAKQSLRYNPGLQDAIERELFYLLELAISNYITTAILADVTQSATDADHVTAILAAIATVEGQGLPVDAILIDPVDLAAIQAAAWTGNKYMPAVEGNRLLGYPAIPAPALPDGTALVGNFSVGAHVYVGDAARVLTNNEVNTNNTTLFVAEGDVAVTVDAPRWFAKAIRDDTP